MPDKAILYDASKCIFCKTCMAACKQWNQLPAGNALQKSVNGERKLHSMELGPNTWLTMCQSESESKIGVTMAFGRVSCMHCTQAVCLDVCPVHAISRTDDGFIVIREDLCIGCKTCNYQCPFQVPKYDKETGITIKCWLCQNRITENTSPACVSACPTEALIYGSRKELLYVARQRLKTLRNDNYFLFGEHELGGLHVMQLLNGAPSRFGIPDKAQVPLTTVIWGDYIRPVGELLSAAALAGIFISWLVNLGSGIKGGRDGQ